MEKLKQAIETAKSSLNEIQGNVKNITVEQAILNEDKRLYEITLGYRVTGKDNLGDNEPKNALAALYAVPSFGKVYKTFLIDQSTGEFKGFKIFNEA